MTAHKIIFFWGWGIWMDLAIMFGRFFKSWKHYMTVHILMFIVLDFSTVVIVSMTLYQNRNNLPTKGKGADDVI